MFCTVGPEKSFIPKLAKILHTNGVEHVEFGLVKKLYTEVDLVEIAQRNNWEYEELWTLLKRSERLELKNELPSLKAKNSPKTNLFAVA